MNANLKDAVSGVVFILAGLLYGSIAFVSLPIGRALNMGPGYFPIILSTLLIGMGGVIAMRGMKTRADSPFGAVAWRGLIMISLSIVFFAVALWPLGMLPTAILTALIACWGSASTRLFPAMLIASGIGIFCTVIFNYIIKLPVPLIGTLFG